MLKNVKNYLLIAALILPISGCVTTKTKIIIEPLHRQKLVLPTPSQFMSDPVHWYILSKKIPAGQKGSIEDFWSYAEKSGASAGLVLTPNDYKALARNNSKLRKFILQQQALIKAYKKYYNDNN